MTAARQLLWPNVKSPKVAPYTGESRIWFEKMSKSRHRYQMLFADAMQWSCAERRVLFPCFIIAGPWIPSAIDAWLLNASPNNDGRRGWHCCQTARCSCAIHAQPCGFPQRSCRARLTKNAACIQIQPSFAVTKRQSDCGSNDACSHACAKHSSVATRQAPIQARERTLILYVADCSDCNVHRRFCRSQRSLHCELTY